MAYTPYYSGGWQSGEQGGTPITPAALNNMENGIQSANSQQIRNVSIPYDLAANTNMHQNLKTLIDADLPSGYTFSGIVGFTSNNSNVVIIACAYINNDYGFQLRNFGSSGVATNAIVYYSCMLS